MLLRIVSVLLLGAAAAAQVKPEPLVIVREGTVPIIVSAPHGGRVPLKDVTVRRGDGIAQFVTGRDDNTAELAEKLAARIEKQVGGKPYLVIAKFERRFIDVNRPAESAYEDDRAKPHYEAYHQALRDFTRDVQRAWGRGLLIDVHGQGAEADAIFRGTSNGKTVKALTDRFGQAAVTGPKGLYGGLASQGFKVIPANDSKDAEDKRYNGGHIVRTYGSHDGQAIDAMQLELGSNLRAKASLDDTADKIATAVAAFHKEYLPAAKRK